MNGKTLYPPPAREYHISPEESDRLQILKIWLSVMVVFIHSNTETVYFSEGNLMLDVPVWLDWTKYVLSQVIAQCAVPGFFFMSAVFLYRKAFTWTDNIRRKVRTLLVPYLLINSAWIAFFFIAQHIGALSPLFSSADNTVSNWSAAEFLNAYLGINRLRKGDNYPLVYQLWFMRDLMVLNVLAVIIKKAIDRAPRLILLLLMAMTLFGIQTHIPVLRADALVFFCLGYYFVKYDMHIKDVDRLDPVILAGLYAMTVALDCMSRGMPQQQLIRPFTIVLGFAFFLRFTTKGNSPGRKRRLLSLSGYAVPVYLFHEKTLTFLRKLMTRLLPTDAFFQVLGYFGIPVVVIGLCIAGSWLMKKWTPRLYSVLTGGRTM